MKGAPLSLFCRGSPNQIGSAGIPVAPEVSPCETGTERITRCEAPHTVYCKRLSLIPLERGLDGFGCDWIYDNNSAAHLFTESGTTRRNPLLTAALSR